MKTRALDIFHRPPHNYNCAQAILAASGETGIDIESYRAFGGGRAPGGLCGAIAAACQIRPAEAERLKAAFLQEVGHLNCASIKAAGKPSCKDCVAIAAELMQSLHTDSQSIN